MGDTLIKEHVIVTIMAHFVHYAVVAKGDWTKDLVHLAKTAELKSVFRSHRTKDQNNPSLTGSMP